jgi:hypothetical protein
VSLVVGRDRELSVLRRVLDDYGPRVCFVYGMAGIGKSTLLDRFGVECAELGVSVFAVDCGSIDPTEGGFLEGLAAAGGGRCPPSIDGGLLPVREGGQAVLLIDTYEVFRIADPWLRHGLLPALGPAVRVIVASRDAPMLEWAVDRGRLGGLEVLPLGPLDEPDVAAVIAAAGVTDGPAATTIARVARGHPLAVRLALEAQLAGAELPVGDVMSTVVDALAGVFRDGLDAPSRRALDAAAVPRRVTRGVLEAMLGPDADDALTLLNGLSFVESTVEGFKLHDAVHIAIGERLRAVDPDEHRRLRSAAWQHLQAATLTAGSGELARSTADLLFLIDNPVVREAMFPTTAHRYSVELARPSDSEVLQELWHRHDPSVGADALDAWLRLAPGAVRVVRDRTGSVVGCSIVAEWRHIPPSLDRSDPVIAGWARHAATHPLPPGQSTLVHRRVLSDETGEGPSGAQAAAWLDLKRDYFRLRPQLGRLYTGIFDPEPYLPALLTLGFSPFGPPVDLGGGEFHLAALDFGPASIDGWLSKLAAAELGITATSFLDATDRSVEVGGKRISLSPLEFGVLYTLAVQPGKVITRIDLLEHVWGTSYAGGSNVVDVVIRSLRRKLGSDASRVQTVRGVGYRLR